MDVPKFHPDPEGNGHQQELPTVGIRARQGKNVRREVLLDYNKGFPCCNEDPDDEGNGLFGWVLTSLSLFIVILTLPFSLCVCLKVVQEYERAVIFR
jgi:hypothetical protein